ncbi:MAG: hypothetical protein HFH87_00565 [Lachnospiraceae bacterium]|nr:hypothetical protein [Lachnospiraceae bacterium]
MFWKRKSGAEKQLDEKLDRIQKNFENNYKDAAQLNLKEFEDMFRTLSEEGKLTEKQKVFYENQLEELNGRMKNFTHKDQKPFWV